MQIVKCKTSLFTGSFYLVDVLIQSVSGRSFTLKIQALQPPGSCDQVQREPAVHPCHHSPTGLCYEGPGLQSRASSCAALLAATVATPGILCSNVLEYYVLIQGRLGEAGEGPAEGEPRQDLEGVKEAKEQNKQLKGELIAAYNSL